MTKSEETTIVPLPLSDSDARALDALWRSQGEGLKARLIGWYADPHFATDVVHDVFQRLASNPEMLHNLKNPAAFLTVVGRRVAIDLRRKMTTKVAYHEAAGLEMESAYRAPLTDKSLQCAIAAAMKSLPEEQLRVLKQKLIEGKTLDQIAQVEGVSLNTVASRLRYALDKLRNDLRPYYEDLINTTMKTTTLEIKESPKRIITPLQPKRIPSVLVGLEGLAAAAPDWDLPDAHCEVADEVIAQTDNHGSEGSFQDAPEVHPVDAAKDELVSIFDKGLDEEIDVTLVGCPAPVMPETWVCELPYLDVDPDGVYLLDSQKLLADYYNFLAENTHWLDSDSIEAQVITQSSFFSDLEFGTPSQAAAFDKWYLTTLESNIPDNEGNEGLDGGWSDDETFLPEDWTSGYDPAALLKDYEGFLNENPEWVSDYAESVQTQEVTPSTYFADLQFETPDQAFAFDAWFKGHYDPVYSYDTYILGKDLGHDAEIMKLVDGSVAVLDRSDMPASVETYDAAYSQGPSTGQEETTKVEPVKNEGNPILANLPEYQLSAGVFNVVDIPMPPTADLSETIITVFTTLSPGYTELTLGDQLTAMSASNEAEGSGLEVSSPQDFAVGLGTDLPSEVNTNMDANAQIPNLPIAVTPLPPILPTTSNIGLGTLVAAGLALPVKSGFSAKQLGPVKYAQ